MSSIRQNNVSEQGNQVWGSTEQRVSARAGMPAYKGPLREIVVTYGDPWETEPCELLPPDDFDDAAGTPIDRRTLRSRFGESEEDTGPDSSAVRSRFMSCTAGWPVPPTSGEFYLAVQAEDPSSRQKTVIRAWLAEATYREIIRAWMEEAFSWRDLVAAVHRVGYCSNGLNRYLNQFARCEAKRSVECLPQPSI